MAQFSHRNQIAHTSGDLLPKAITLRIADSPKRILLTPLFAAYAGKRVVLNIFPSIDTGTCAKSVRRIWPLHFRTPSSCVSPKICGFTKSDSVEQKE